MTLYKATDNWPMKAHPSTHTHTRQRESTGMAKSIKQTPDFHRVSVSQSEPDSKCDDMFMSYLQPNLIGTIHSVSPDFTSSSLSSELEISLKLGLDSGLAEGADGDTFLVTCFGVSSASPRLAPAPFHHNPAFSCEFPTSPLNPRTLRLTLLALPQL